MVWSQRTRSGRQPLETLFPRSKSEEIFFLKKTIARGGVVDPIKPQCQKRRLATGCGRHILSVKDASGNIVGASATPAHSPAGRRHNPASTFATPSNGGVTLSATATPTAMRVRLSVSASQLQRRARCTRNPPILKNQLLINRRRTVNNALDTRSRGVACLHLPLVVVATHARLRWCETALLTSTANVGRVYIEIQYSSLGLRDWALIGLMPYSLAP